MQTNLFTSGARLVWRHQRLMWWIFAVNLFLGWLVLSPVKGVFGPFLNHSLASSALVDRFDLGTFFQLLSEPEISVHLLAAYSMHFSLIFLAYMIFINGGVLTVYGEDRKLPRAEFFEMSGAYFWRMFRLVLLSIIPFAIIGGIYAAISAASDKLTNEAVNDRTGFYVLVAGCIVVWIAALFVRLWFDMAQSLTVAQNERSMLRMTWRGFVRSLRNIVPLLSAYISIHIVGILALIGFCLLTLHFRHQNYFGTWLVLEIMLVIEIAVRLWQKAACMTWVQLHAVTVSTPSYELSPLAAIPTAPPAPTTDNPPPPIAPTE